MLTDTPLSVADVLERAAEKVGEGWCQHTFQSGDCYCALGAIAAACGTTGFQADFGDGMPGKAADVLRKSLNVRLIDDWNDRDERTQPEVVAALRRAAELARAGDA